MNGPLHGETESRSPAVEMHDVSYSFNGDSVITGASFDIPSGTFVSIVGPNGGGKTTLIKLMLGLYRPGTGTVRVLGKKPSKVRSRIGYMPQESNADPRFPVTVLDAVQMGLIGSRYEKESRSKRRDIALRALSRMMLDDRADDPVSSLSGGMKRRMLVARSIVSDPELLILDEPTANVDFLAEQELISILKDLVPEMTIIMASHDLVFVSEYVESVICVNRNVAVHATGQLSSEAFKEVFGKDIKLVMHDQHFHSEDEA